MRTIGNFLVLFALTGGILTFGQALYQESLYRINSLRGVQFSIADKPAVEKETSGFGDAPTTVVEEVIPIVPVATDFAVVIPKINANAQVIPNVDAGNYDDYMAALKVGVAHASGSVFPGTPGNVYLFAHSTDYFWNVGRYNAVFYLLKELQKGDEVDIFYAGRRHVYTVDETKIVSPDDVSYLNDSLQGEERLTLQTCWPPGTTIKRLVVIAKPKVSI